MKVSAENCEAVDLIAELGDFGDGKQHVFDAAALRCLAQVHQLIAVAMRQRLQQHAVDDAEDRRVGADPQSQRQHERQGVARRMRQAAQGKTEVSPKSAHHGLDLQSIAWGAAELGSSREISRRCGWAA